MNIMLKLLKKGDAVIDESLISGLINSPIIGQTDPTTGTGMCCSSNAPAVHKAKWNAALAVALGIITRKIKIAAVTFGNIDSVYCEFEELSTCIHDGEYQTTTATNTEQDVATLVAYLISNPSNVCDEVRTLYKQMAEEIADAGKTTLKTALTFCDSVYYTLSLLFPKDEKNNLLLKDGEPLAEANIKELARIADSIPVVDFKTNGVSNNEFRWVNPTGASTKTKKKATSSTKPFPDACRDGEYILAYNWDAESRLYIPPLSYLEYFVFTPDFECMVKLVYDYGQNILTNLDMGMTGADAIGDFGKAIMAIGKPGSGKSTMFKALAATLGIPLHISTTTRYSEEDAYQGKNKFVGSENSDSTNLRFCETPFLKGFKHGGLIVLEEFNLADQGMLMGALGQAIEKPYLIEENGYAPVERHPLAFIAMTSNIGTQGSQTPNAALTSRAPHVFRIDDPQDSDFLTILRKHAPRATAPQVERVFQAYKRLMDILKSLSADDLLMDVTLRSCAGALDELVAGIPYAKAIEQTIINPLYIYAPEMANEIKEALLAADK